jgi:hypothetical protein
VTSRLATCPGRTSARIEYGAPGINHGKPTEAAVRIREGIHGSGPRIVHGGLVPF